MWTCFSVASVERNSSADSGANSAVIRALYDHSVCQWPGCDTLCKDLSGFVGLVSSFVSKSVRVFIRPQMISSSRYFRETDLQFQEHFVAM